MIGPTIARRLPAAALLVALCLTAAVGTQAATGPQRAQPQSTVSADGPTSPPQLQRVGNGNTIDSVPSAPAGPRTDPASRSSWPEVALVGVAVVIVLIALFNRRSSAETPRRRGDPPNTPPSRKQRVLGH